MINKLKHPIICLIWNVCMWGIVFIEELLTYFLRCQIERTGHMMWAHIGIVLQVSIWILLGLGLGWLVSRPLILSRIDIVMELCILLIGNAVLVFATSPFGFMILGSFPIFPFTTNLRYVGSLIIGVAIIRLSQYIQHKKTIKP